MMTDGEYLAAVEEAHPCEDYHCDIRAAAKAGFGRVAAFLLYGATEVQFAEPTMDFDSDEWRKWEKYVHTYGRECLDCEAINFATDVWEPQTCGNCSSEYLVPLNGYECIDCGMIDLANDSHTCGNCGSDCLVRLEEEKEQ